MKYKLKDLCTTITDGSHFSPKAQSCGFPMLSVKDMREYDFSYKNCKRISNEDFLILKKNGCVPQKGDVLVAKDGSYLKEIFVCKENKNEAVLSSIAIFRPNTNLITSEFLCYLLKSPGVFNYIKNNCVSGSALPRIVLKTFKEIILDVPDIETQIRICGVLNPIDAQIISNREINDNLLQQVFAFFDNQFSDITAGSYSVSDYILPKRGRGLLSKDAIKGDVPVVAGGLEPSTYHNAANTVSPVITISASGANAGFIRLWNIPVWSSDSSFIDSSVTDFVYFWFVLVKKRQDEIYSSQTGSAQPHIYPQNIGSLPICELDMSEVKQYNDLVTPLFIKIGANESENVKLAHLRDTLLPKLMTGEVDLDSLNV